MEKIEATVSFAKVVDERSDRYVTRSELEEIIETRLSSLRIHLIADDITALQERARTLADYAEF